ncbi:MAG: copper resistance protein NlpE N-terminal domain-containing protein, partial [Balneolaceae bacterium]|nr:copper resistance protein NlpE N-terminal domain-containing protein [Balneolaceae bacterium]
PSTEQNNGQLGINLPAMYTGSLPCADCPSIRYSLIIDDSSFTEISIYDNDPNARFKKNGPWTVMGDTLSILDSENSPIKRFLVNEESLFLLDRENQEITGDLADKYTLERTGNQPSIREHHQKLASQGFKFFAGGNEPFWSVKMDSLNQLIFETPDSTQRFGRADSSKKGDQVSLSASTESRRLTIQSEDKYCQDSMNGYLFPQNVTLILQTTERDTLSGCGLFLNR